MDRDDKDWDKIAAYERYFADRYGEEVLQDVRQNLDPDKHKKYRKELDKFYQKIYSNREEQEMIEKNGYRVSKRLLNKEVPPRTCGVCDSYSFNVKDDIYLLKFGCCFDCFIEFVEGREDEWDINDARQRRESK